MSEVVQTHSRCELYFLSEPRCSQTLFLTSASPARQVTRVNLKRARSDDEPEGRSAKQPRNMPSKPRFASLHLFTTKLLTSGTVTSFASCSFASGPQVTLLQLLRRSVL